MALEAYKRRVVPYQRGYRRVRVAYRHFVQVGEVVRPRLPVVVDAGIQRLVCAVAVDEHARVLRGVVKLAESHACYLRAERVRHGVAYLVGVHRLPRGFCECHCAFSQIIGVGARFKVRVGLQVFHVIHADKPLFRQGECRRLAVRGYPQAPLSAQAVDLLHRLTAPCREHGHAHKRPVAVHVL